jgi:hypothetical protein
MKPPLPGTATEGQTYCFHLEIETSTDEVIDSPLVENTAEKWRSSDTHTSPDALQVLHEILTGCRLDMSMRDGNTTAIIPHQHLGKTQQRRCQGGSKVCGGATSHRNNDPHVDIDEGSTTCRTSMAKEEQRRSPILCLPYHRCRCVT